MKLQNLSKIGPIEQKQLRFEYLLIITGSLRIKNTKKNPSWLVFIFN